MSGMDHDERSFDASGPNTPGQGDGGVTPHRQNGSSARSQIPPSGDNIIPPVPGDQTVISKKTQLSAKQTVNLPPPIDSGRLRPGDKLGHYELLEFVGGGGMGRVFRALDTKLDRHVAVKVLPCEQVADPETLQRFRNEARSAARLDHDNIARAYDLGEDRGLSYLVFEFVEGTTIRDLVERRGPLTLADALSYTLQVADALAHAASRGIVHRDVKPSNILVTNEGRAKLIDMGLARIQNPHDANDDLTATGVTLGTFDYISPEQARDPRSADVRSDIYSLGCTFFYMLTGRPPFPEGTVLQKLLQHQGDEPPDIHEFRPEMPEQVSAVLRKLLAKDPNRRYQTADELVEHLQQLAAEIGLRPIDSSPRAWAASQPRRVPFLQHHLPWIAPVAALLLIWLGLHLYWSYTAQNPLSPGDIASPSSYHPPGDNRLSADIDQPPPIASTAAAGNPIPPHTSQNNSVEPDLPKKLTTNQTRPRNDSPDMSWLNSNALPSLPTAGDASGAGSIPDDPGAEAGGKTLMPAPSPTPWQDNKTATAANSLPPTSPPATTPAEPSASATAQPPPSIEGVLVVDPLGKHPGTYATLRAACHDAQSGDVIELRYNGRQEEKPLALHNVKITIRAGKQSGKQFRPVVVFHANEPDPSKYPRGMFNLSGTRLTLVDLAIELDIPKAVPAEEWSLFELGRAETIRLQKCSLTIRNAFDNPQAYHEEVAFFKIQAAAADTSLGETSQKNGTKKSAQIDLLDCIARGEAVLARTEKLQPLRLSWENGLFVSSEQLLRTEGGQKSPPPDDKIEIELRHLTLVVNSGLCRIAGSQFASHQLPTSINCTDSIVLSGNSQALVQQIGSSRPSEMQKLFTYSGDRNCYQGFNIFWRIENLEPNATPELLEWEAWQTYWAPDHENHSLWCRVDWKNLPQPSPLPHTCTPWDYMLSESEENPTRYAASDGSDVGFNRQKLPPLPR